MPHKNKKSATVLAVFIAALSLSSSNAQETNYRTPKWLQASLAVHAAQSTNRLIVKFKAESTAVLPSGAVRAKALTAAAGQPLRHLRSLGDRVEVIALPTFVSNAEARRIAAQIQADPSVEYAEPDYKMFPALTPSDPGFSPGIDFDASSTSTAFVSQWYLFNSSVGINAPTAWDTTTGSASTIIAVVDTGVLNHVDLSGRLVTGYDFIGADPNGSFDTANDGNGRDPDASDPGNWISAGEQNNPNFSGCGATLSDFHGTHVAGIIAADANTVSTVGINWAAKILSVRVLGKCGGYTSDIVDGMRWAVGISIAGVPANTNRANIVNLSLGIASESSPPSCSRTIQSAINDVLAGGATVVSAAGNGIGNVGVDSANSIPANCAGVISVSATLIDGQRASYSNFGPLVTLSAPGGFIAETPTDFGQNGILSLNDRGTTAPLNDHSTASLFGTSFSSAMVSGVASLLLDVNPGLTPAQIKGILQSTARSPSNPSSRGLHCAIATTPLCQQYIVDATAAVAAAGQGMLSALDSNGNPISLLDFGSTTLSAPSAPQTFFVRNATASTIRISDIKIAGHHPGDFSASSACANAPPSSGFPFDLAAGLECQIDVTFTAKGNNVRTANIIIASNVDLPIAVTGSGPTIAAGGDSSGGGGGGGCTVNIGERFDPTVFLLLAISVIALYSRRNPRR